MAGIIPKKVLEEIRFRSDIVDVIGSYFTLKRAGSSFKALCPFHKEKTPSFHVNPQRQIYHCFGCGAGGDVFAFVMQYEGVDFTTAARILAERAGIRIEYEGGSGEEHDKALLYKIHEEIAEFYQRCLARMKSAERARQYLKTRELDDSIVAEFSIGYAPDRWNSVLQWAEKKGYRIKNLLEAGMVLESAKENRKHTRYDRFRNRLMFPIRDELGRTIGFSGRSLSAEEKTAKYINSPETPLFTKGRVLYAIDKARRHIAESGEAVLCEGQIDVIRCHQAGFNTAVAAQGTAFTDDHVRVLKRYADSVCIVFDPDKAGQDAAIRAAVTFIKGGVAVKTAVLPEGEDPDSLIRRKGGDAFAEILENALSAAAFQVRVLSSRENPKGEVGAMRIARAVLSTISNSPNAVQRARLVQEAAALLDLPAEALNDDLRFMLRKSRAKSQRRIENSGAPASPEEKDRENAPEPPPEEVQICEHLVNISENPELGPLVEKFLPLDMISDAMCRMIAEAALKAGEKGSDIQEVLRESDKDSPRLQQFTARLMMAPLRIKGEETSREDAVKDLILCCWRRRFREERKRLAEKGDVNRADMERRASLAYRMKALGNWDSGSDVIQIELAG
ncbi:MAG: DNA primase [Kiritimatiellia bacterium]